MSTSQQSPAAAFWDAHYGRHPQVWSGRPNAVLVDETADLPPGTALDLGCGEGADAIWLARRGWHVTAVDVSRTALDRGDRLAEAGVDKLVDWQLHDLADTFPTGAYNLVTAQYLHAPIDLPRDRILRAAAAAVAPAGTLLLAGHASSPPWAPHPAPHGAFPDPADTARTIGLHDSDWMLVTCELRERPTTGPSGEPATVSDSVIKARRR